MDMSTGQGHNVLYFPVSAPAVAGDTQIIAADAAVPPRKFRIFSLVLVAKAAVTVTLKSGSTPISGPMPLAIGAVLQITGEPAAHFAEVAAGQALVITTSADGVYGFVGVTVDPR